MVLLSGGMDSTTVATLARRQVDRLTAITFLYGQTHRREVDCAREVAGYLGVRHELIDISGLASAAWYSSLTNPRNYPLPRDRISDGTPQETTKALEIPSTYVPLRNTLLIAMAAAFLESVVLHAIEVESVPTTELSAQIFVAPNAIDYSGYPDCRPEYYEKLREALLYGSKLWTQYHVPITIETPIIQLSKGQIVQLALELDAPLDLTWTCYENGPAPCGRCDSCILRARGFREAGYEDPILASRT